MRHSKVKFVGMAAFLMLAVAGVVDGLAGEFIGDNQGEPVRDLVGSPTPLPYVSTALTSGERELAERLALDDPTVALTLKGKRYRFNGAHIAHEKTAPCDQPAARACARVGIFNYTDGTCLDILLDLGERRLLSLSTRGGCSLSREEATVAREVVEADPLAQDVLRQRDARYGHAKLAIKPDHVPGHRYVSVVYSTDGGTRSAEFIVDLTTEIVCREC